VRPEKATQDPEFGPCINRVLFHPQREGKSQSVEYRERRLITDWLTGSPLIDSKESTSIPFLMYFVYFDVYSHVLCIHVSCVIISITPDAGNNTVILEAPMPLPGWESIPL
jgi:hypothetical protein